VVKMKGKNKIKFLILLFLFMLHCGPAIVGGKVSGNLKNYLSAIPEISVEIKNYGILSWQKQRAEKVKEKLLKCLPPILNPLCGKKGCNFVISSDSMKSPRQKNKLTVKFEYERSSHFMDGFVLISTFEMRDSANLETILKYHYYSEPKTNVYYEKGMDKDEIFTVDTLQITDKFCRELGNEIQNIH